MKKKKVVKVTDFEKLKKFLKKNKIAFYQGSANGFTTYTLISFDDDGKALLNSFPL